MRRWMTKRRKMSVASGKGVAWLEDDSQRL